MRNEKLRLKPGVRWLQAAPHRPAEPAPKCLQQTHAGRLP